MRNWRWIICVLGSLAAAVVPAAEGYAGKLDSPYPLDLRGVPLRVVLDDLSRDLGVPYLVDGSVAPDVLELRLRLFAKHVTGRQAFRWAARFAGVEAAIREDMVLIAARRQLPRVWRLTGGEGGPPTDDDRLRDAGQRRVDIEWIDMPLSAVSRSISHEYGIDMIFHPRLVATAGLVHIEQPQATLDAVRAAIVDQLKARTAVLDGVIWAVPLDEQVEAPATQPSSASSQPHRFPTGRQPASLLERQIELDGSVRSWNDLRERLTDATGVRCRLAGGGVAWKGPFEARGNIGDVLEAARLMGTWAWRLVDGSAPGEIALEIRPGPANP